MQEAAHAGYYCQLMSGFIQWLAHDLEGARERVRQQMTEYHQQLQKTPGHAQSKEVAASLLAAMETLMQYLVKAQFMTTADLTQHLEKAHEVFAQGMQYMAAQVADEDPVQVFQQLLVEGIVSQQLMLHRFSTSSSGNKNQDPERQNHHPHPMSESMERRRSLLIGYDTYNDVIYLLPEPCSLVQLLLPVKGVER